MSSHAGSFASEKVVDDEKPEGTSANQAANTQRVEDIEKGGLDMKDGAIAVVPDDTPAQQVPVEAPKTGRAHVSDISSIPNGGLKAWLQVLGSFFLFFNSWGIVNTYGVYQTYYAIDILKTSSESTIAWIGSVQIFLLLIVGVATGPIYDSGGFHYLLGIGSFLIVFGHMMLSLCHNFWQVLLAQAFCIGIGLGCLFVPSVAIISTYFHSRLAMATGMAASGSSLGGVIYPIVLDRLYPRLGFGWTVRVIGFMTLATLLVPNLVMRVRVLPPARRKFVDPLAFKHPAFMLFGIGTFITFLGLFQPFFFVQSYAYLANITSENLAFYLIPMLNATSILGRIFPNIVADKTGPMNMLVPGTLISGALVTALVGIHTQGSIIAFVLLFGFFSGCLVSLPPTVVVHLTQDRRFIGTRMGMLFSFVGLGALVGSPIGGAIYTSHGFRALWIFGGVLNLSGGVLIYLSRVLHKGWNPFIKA